MINFLVNAKVFQPPSPLKLKKDINNNLESFNYYI